MPPTSRTSTSLSARSPRSSPSPSTPPIPPSCSPASAAPAPSPPPAPTPPSGSSSPPARAASVAIDPTNPALWYLSTAAGISVVTCTQGADCTPADLTSAVTAAQTSGDLALLDAPWLLDPAAPASLVAGTCRVWRGPAATPALWSISNALSPLLSGPQNPACALTNAFLNAVAAGGDPTTGPGSPVLYAGMAGKQNGGGNVGGHIFRTLNANLPSPVWTDLAASPVANDSANAGRFNPGGFPVSSITVDLHDSTGYTVYATLQGFSGNGFNVPLLYRSTDAGAHWTNLSANLPYVPANAVLVDPNDANTVYIALDTGVYVTTQITSCPTVNCWSLFGASLPNAPVTALAAGAALPTGDGRLGLLRAGTYGRGLWQIPLLTASTLEQPVILLSPSTLAFAVPQAVGTASVAQTISVTNTGNAPLLVSGIAVASHNAPTGVTTVVTDFTAAGTCTGAVLAPGATCSLSVTFAPSATGLRSSTLTLYANVAGGQATLALSGSATAPSAVELTPTSLAFPATTLAAHSPAQNLVLSNTGGAPITIAAVALTGADFQLTANTCGVTLAPATSCAFSVVFAPAATGARSATLTVTDDLGTQTATLTGTAQTPPTDALSATALTFPATEVTGSGFPQQLILTNSGDLALTLITAAVAGPDFTVTNACGNSLAPHSACALAVSFVPHTVGPVSSTLTVSDVFRNQTIALSGTGIAPPGVSLLPAGTITYPATGVGQASSPKVFTLTNNGGLPLILQSVTLTGDYALAPGSTCGVSLAPSTACTLAVAFTPTATGPRTGSIAIVSNAPNSPESVSLTGNAIDFTFTADGITSSTIPSGGHATFALLLSAPPTAAGTPTTLACSGVPTNATCHISPSTLALNNTPTLVTVTINTGVAPTTANTAFTPTNPSSRMERRPGSPASEFGSLGWSAGEEPASLPRTVWSRAPFWLSFRSAGEESASLPQNSSSRPKAQHSEAELGRPALLPLTLAVLLPLALTLRRGQSLPRLLPTLALALLPLALAAGLSGCGGTGRQMPGDGSGGSTPTASATPTPAGTYTITITATSAGLTRSVDLSLTVQ